MTLPSYAMSQASFPEMYERWLAGPLFRPFAEMTLEEVGLRRGHRVLDLACGTGIVARVAKERLGDVGCVVGIDLSPGMLAVARTVAPNIDWREGNASALPLQVGEQFDIVTCQQGLQFFPDKPAAVDQMRQALVKGGTLAVTTWRSDNEIPLFRELRHLAERYLGPIMDQRFSFGYAAQLVKLIDGGGFHDVRVRTVQHRIRFDDEAPFVRLNAMAYVGMSANAKNLGEQERESIVENIVSETAPTVQRYSQGSVLAFDISTNLATAKG